jgi:galactose mutarotase-like enzyme
LIEIRYIFDWDHKPVNEYTIKNGRYQISAINIGAAITKIIVPNKHDKLENITLRYFDYKDYKNNKFLLGSLIDYQKFIDHQNCQINNYFECVLDQNTIIFKYDIEDKYIKVKYSLLDNNILIEYDTNSDLLLSNVIYFNLTGNLKGDIKDHNLLIGNDVVDLLQDIENFKRFEVTNENELMLLNLEENGIKVALDSIERNISISNGKDFNKMFYINKKIEAVIYSGVGIVIGGNKFNKFVNYEFNKV